MKRLTSLLCLCVCLQLQGATKVILRDTASKIAPSPDFLWKAANSTNGASVQTAVTSTIVGNVTGQYWPSPTASHIVTKTAGGTKVVWISDPISTASVTVSGTITPNLWCVESASTANAALRYEVFRWSVARGGVVSSLGISTDDGMAECTTTVRTSPTLTPTSTAFVAGDRIMIVLYNDDGSGTTETASSRSMTVNYDAATTATGDTYLSFTETIAFSADSNNARPIPAARLILDRWPALAALWHLVLQEMA